jgi:hypothetical protein
MLPDSLDVNRTEAAGKMPALPKLKSAASFSSFYPSSTLKDNITTA